MWFSRQARLILQMEAAECGAACLAMVLSTYGRHIGLEEARERCGTSRDGVDAAALVRAAESYGLKVKAVSREPEELAQLPLPAILHWNFNHFVVLQAVKGDQFTILDPACGKRLVDRKEFGRSFTGLTLAVAPGPSFQAGGFRPSIIAALLKEAAGSYDGLAIMFACGVMAIIPGLLLSGLVQTFTSYVLSSGERQWLLPIVGGLAAVIAIQSLLTAMRGWIVARLTAKISMTVAARAFEHALFVPLSFYSQRSPGDVVSRLRTGSEIGGMVAGPLGQFVPNLIVICAYLAVISVYDLVLGVAIAVIAVANIMVLVRLSRRLSEANHLHSTLDGTASGIAAAGFMAFDSFRLLGREDLFAKRWIDAEEAAIDAEQQLSTAKALANLGPLASSLLISACVLLLGAWRVMQGDLELDALMALQVLAALVASPIASIASGYCAIQDSAGALMRLNDLAAYPPEQIIRRQAGDLDRTAFAMLAQDRDSIVQLRLNGVSFGYGTRAPVLDKVILDIPAGRLTAVVGPSGAGKSTFARICAGMLSPREGQVTLGGRSLAQWPHDMLRQHLLYVPQKSAVVSGSIRENVTMWNEGINDNDIYRVLELLDLTRVVDLKGGLDAPLAAHQATLSGGEIQRLALARALVLKPSVLILDEVTSALDTLSERTAIDALRHSGATVVLVTHRLGSESRCDHILRLDGRGGVICADVPPPMAADPTATAHDRLRRFAGGLGQ